jgi:hypothetical protein
VTWVGFLSHANDSPRLGSGTIDQARKGRAHRHKDVELFLVTRGETLALLEQISLTLAKEQYTGVVFSLGKGSEDAVVKTLEQGEIPTVGMRQYAVVPRAGQCVPDMSDIRPCGRFDNGSPVLLLLDTLDLIDLIPQFTNQSPSCGGTELIPARLLRRMISPQVGTRGVDGQVGECLLTCHLMSRR